MLYLTWSYYNAKNSMLTKILKKHYFKNISKLPVCKCLADKHPTKNISKRHPSLHSILKHCNIICMSGPRYERMSDGGQRGLAVSY